MKRVYFKYFCTKYQRYLDKRERELHDCFHHQRMKEKLEGKPCRKLVKIPV